MKKLTTEQRDWLIEHLYVLAFIHADRDEEYIAMKDVEFIIKKCTEENNEQS